ncbi:DUF6651 domain-containing protein [Paraburkholderia sp.]|uniref:DUF6651 domain-containing protein n=1 Tax=Paraburkholderia sp. TaxID=1926495 RepID=UPI0039E6F5E2
MHALLRKMMIAQGYMDAAGDDGSKSGGAAAIAAGLEAEKAKEAAAKAAAEEADRKAAEAAAEEERKKAAGGGEKKPTDEEAKLLKEVMQKKAKLDEATTALAAAQEQLKKFDGIDPEAVRALLKEKSDAETAALEAKGEWNRLKERMAEEHGKETKSLKDQIAELQKQVGQRDGTINELTVGAQFNTSQFIGSELALTPAKTRVIYGDHFDLVEGKVVGYDKPKGSANRTMIVNSSGVPVSFDEALRKIVEADPEKDHLLKSKVKPGAGSASQAQARAGAQKEGVSEAGVSRIAAGLKTLGVRFNP